MSLNTPQEILGEIQAVRAHLIWEMEKASGGAHGGRLPRGIRGPRTIQEGLAWIQGTVDRDFILPPLDYYFAAMRRCDMKNVPAWKGEPENELESLEAIDAIIACCRQATKGKRRRTYPRAIKKLTPKEVESLQMYGDHNGNFTSAAKVAGKSRQAFKKLFDKAIAKIGPEESKRLKTLKTLKTQALPTDRRGQANVKDPQAIDLNRNPDAGE